MISKIQKKNSLGISLVEIMVSMAISLILLLGIANIYLGSKETYRVREDFGILQEMGRQVLETITSSIQMTDHWGGVPVGNVTVGTIGTLTGTGSCDSTWMQNVSQTLAGADGAGTKAGLGLISDCIDGYVPNSDILIMRYADGKAVSDAEVVAGTPNLYVRSEVENAAVLFSGPTNPISATGISASDAARNYRYRIEVYFLRNCSDAACSDGIPSLARLTTDPVNGLTLGSEVLADGVEQLQFQYGVDTNGDTVAEQFVNAGNVADWSQVVAVNVDMLVRTPTPDHSIADTTVYNLAGGTAVSGGINFTPSTAEQPYHRKQLNKSIQVRNRVRT